MHRINVISLSKRRWFCGW